MKNHRVVRRAAVGAVSLLLITIVVACQTIPPPTDPEQALIAKGRDLFFNETFNGNGRTCGTCHPSTNNFTIDPPFIATLPDDDPLFVAEFIPALAENFENPRLMREFGLIIENLDGFGDLANVFTQRGVPHTLALPTSIDSPAGPRTGWSGDGSPGDGSLRSFAVGAVIQHFPLTTNRVPGVDFRLPTEDELDALEAFQLSLGRQEDLQLPLPLKNPVALRGQVIFRDNNLGKCNLCHQNAGANASLAGNNLGNANFDTGVENLSDQPIDLIGELVPPDDGFGTPGDGTFNTPSIVEAADTPPFFHNNSVATLVGAVGFYNTPAFNNSPAGQVLASFDPNGVGIRLDVTQVESVAAFLAVINALENIRTGIDLLTQMNAGVSRADRKLLGDQAFAETQDIVEVLRTAGLHGDAMNDLNAALELIERATDQTFYSKAPASDAISRLQTVRDILIEDV